MRNDLQENISSKTQGHLLLLVSCATLKIVTIIKSLLLNFKFENIEVQAGEKSDTACKFLLKLNPLSFHIFA